MLFLFSVWVPLMQNQFYLMKYGHWRDHSICYLSDGVVFEIDCLFVNTFLSNLPT